MGNTVCEESCSAVGGGRLLAVWELVEICRGSDPFLTIDLASEKVIFKSAVRRHAACSCRKEGQVLQNTS